MKMRIAVIEAHYAQELEDRANARLAEFPVTTQIHAMQSFAFGMPGSLRTSHYVRLGPRLKGEPKRVRGREWRVSRRLGEIGRGKRVGQAARS